MDIEKFQKLKYDLSMQYALIDILKNHSEESNSPDFDMRIYIMDKFASYYMHFSMLDGSRWKSLLNQIEEADKLDKPDIFN